MNIDDETVRQVLKTIVEFLDMPPGQRGCAAMEVGMTGAGARLEYLLEREYGIMANPRFPRP